jgi:hypothetical protein
MMFIQLLFLVHAKKRLLMVQQIWEPFGLLPQMVMILVKKHSTSSS